MRSILSVFKIAKNIDKKNLKRIILLFFSNSRKPHVKNENSQYVPEFKEVETRHFQTTPNLCIQRHFHNIGKTCAITGVLRAKVTLYMIPQNS